VYLGGHADTASEYAAAVQRYGQPLAGLLRASAFDRAPQAAPPLPNPSSSGPSQPTSVRPFVVTLGVALVLYGLAVVVLIRRQGRLHAQRAN
jgi:hypothetical protein